NPPRDLCDARSGPEHAGNGFPAMDEFEDFRRRARATDLGRFDGIVLAAGCVLIAADFIFEPLGLAIVGGLLWIGHGWAAWKRGDEIDIARDNPYHRAIEDRQARSMDWDEPSNYDYRDPRRLIVGGVLVVLVG